MRGSSPRVDWWGQRERARTFIVATQFEGVEFHYNIFLAVGGTFQQLFVDIQKVRASPFGVPTEFAVGILYKTCVALLQNFS
jgi:hypothetical protein